MTSRRFEEPATDVLAAEEFGVPAPDPALHREDLRLPSDLVGEKPRDVLAAEEFAMPAPDEAHVLPHALRTMPSKRAVAMNLPAVVGGLWLVRRVRRRRSGSPD